MRLRVLSSSIRGSPICTRRLFSSEVVLESPLFVRKKSLKFIGFIVDCSVLDQLVHAITSNPADKTKITLLFGNITEDDILMKQTLDEVAAVHKDQVKVGQLMTQSLAVGNF